MGFRVQAMWVSRLLAAAVGIIMLIAGMVKGIDIDLFIRQIKDYGILSQYFILTISAWGLIAVECALGVGLILFYRPRFILPITGLLLVSFTGATSWAWLTGATEACGCFGAWLKHTPAKATLESLILLTATLTAWAVYRPSESRKIRAKAWAVMGAFLFGLLLPLAFGSPLYRVGQSPWKSVEMALGRLQVEGGNPAGLKKQTYIAVLMDTECQHCRGAVLDLDSLAEDSDLPPLVVLSMNQELQRMMFVEEFQPAFAIGQIQADVFWRLLQDGDVPRTILVRDGRVQEVWDEFVPDKHMIQAALSK